MLEIKFWSAFNKNIYIFTFITIKHYQILLFFFLREFSQYIVFTNKIEVFPMPKIVTIGRCLLKKIHWKYSKNESYTNVDIALFWIYSHFLFAWLDVFQSIEIEKIDGNLQVENLHIYNIFIYICTMYIHTNIYMKYTLPIYIHKYLYRILYHHVAYLVSFIRKFRKLLNVAYVIDWMPLHVFVIHRKIFVCVFDP